MEQRWLMCWLLFLARSVCQGNRVLLGALLPFIVAEVAMPNDEKGRVLAAFSGGYMLTQVAGGAASDRVGGKALILVAIVAMAGGTLAAPRLMDAAGPAGFAACYFFMGVCEGPSFPTTGSMLARWIPEHERSKAMSIADTGSSLGSMVTFSLAPVVATHAGWRAAFRLWGYGSAVICVLWALLASSGPEACARLSQKERDYLARYGLGVEHPEGLGAKGKRVKRDGFPRALFTYASAWATICAHAAFNFGRYFVYNSLVGFYVDELGLSAVAAGQQFLLGQIADTVGKFAFAPFVDAEILRRPKAKTSVRRLVSGVSFLVFALCMLGLTAARTPAAATLLLVLCKIASSAHVCGFKTTYIDQTARHAGAFSGASNTLATLSAALSPLVGGRVLDGTRKGWVHMFVLIAVVNVVAAFVWVGCASADSLDDKLALAADRRAPPDAPPASPANPKRIAV